MTLRDLNKITEIVTTIWICIKRTDRSHRCPADTNNEREAPNQPHFGFILKFFNIYIYKLALNSILKSISNFPTNSYQRILGNCMLPIWPMTSTVPFRLKP